MTASRSGAGLCARWLPIVLRALVVTVTAYPAIQKFLDYSAQVSEFAAYGVPWPAVAVPLSGVVELLAVVSLAFCVAGRFGAGALASTMVVAIVAAGPNPWNVLILLASIGICILGTGSYSYWSPSVRKLYILPGRTGTAGTSSYFR